MEDFITNFHFLRPEWFIALIPTLILYIALKQNTSKKSGWQSVIPSHLYQHMVVGKFTKGQKPPFWLLALGWLLAVVALAGPTWERLPQPVYQLKMGHVIVMDMSLSMRATDITPDRLTRAKYKAIDLVNQIGEGEMGLVAYAGDAFVVSPLTQDAANITTLLPSLSPEIMPVPGSDPLLGVETAAELLTNAGYSKGMIYWITDGVDLRQQQELQEYVAEMPFTLNALAVGTDDGAPIRQITGELLKDRSGAIVIPKLNSSAVNAIVRASGGKFSEITTNDDDITSLASLSLLDRDSESEEDASNTEGDQWREFGPYLLLALLPLMALGFRRGLVFAVIAAIYMPISSESVMAQSVTQEPPSGGSTSSSVSWWKKPFLNANQEGLANYSDNAFDQAATTFEDPAWQGAAHYKSGDYEQALAAYQKQGGIEGLYNQGNALARLGKLDEAIAKYDEVLKQDPNYQDAAANKTLLEQLKQQQEEQEQQNQENQQSNDSENQQDSGEGENQEGSDDSNQDSQNNDGSNSEDTSEENGEQNPSDNQNANDENDSQSDPQSSQNEGGEQDDSQNQNASEAQDGANGEENDKEDAGAPQNTGNEEGTDEAQQESDAAMAQAGEMTDAEKEQQQRLENLMRRVPDDPAFLLKRKMQLEAQKRQRQRMPSNRSDW
ncbi:vWA domain-containing protein [Alteromonas stellipolaris]|uniref:vWA domain-containing protein n=1 Tax=Alteromonas stellipolaris TaxID=233316 RepID=UPI001D52A57F|nr:VWA domain-containing protein [Alteromonas stellipolaris]MBZ2162593.1 VWA domain-containing protein [Alteromonas stellipolaris]